MTEFVTSRKNEKIVHMKRLGTDKAYRAARREFLCDGEKLLEEAVLYGAEIRLVLTCREEPPETPEGVPVLRAPRELLASVSPLKSPQDVIFVCAMPDAPACPMPGGRYIVLEDVQDPGNVGTVIRSAGAFGMDGVLLTGACADLYNPKTVRATMGAVFRVKVLETDLAGLAQLREDGVPLYGAALGGGCRDVRSVDLSAAAVAVGSEGHGLSPALLALCTGRVRIPMRPECESLNAGIAASILMWEMSRAAL